MSVVYADQKSVAIPNSVHVKAFSYVVSYASLELFNDFLGAVMEFLRCTLFLIFISAAINSAADDCKQSPWGADDQIGAANRLSSANVLAAANLVKKGETHPLGIVIEPGMPAFPPRYTQLQVVQPSQQFGKNGASVVGWDASWNDDIVQMWLGTGPQLDGLGHMGEAGMFYNCNRGEDFAEITGLTRL
ncbi:MAG: hypothetical protein P8O15_06640, partial [Luminiphilus sp.]|nr:hypothetical protein [Luminiphilus sp.]